MRHHRWMRMSGAGLRPVGRILLRTGIGIGAREKWPEQRRFVVIEDEDSVPHSIVLAHLLQPAANQWLKYHSIRSMV